MELEGVVQNGVVVPDDPAALADGTRVRITAPDPSAPRPHRRPGSAKGLLTIVAEDDEHLADFTQVVPDAIVLPSTGRGSP